MTSPAVTLWTAALCKQDPGYGGWAARIGHQYQDTTNLDGVDVDIEGNLLPQVGLNYNPFVVELRQALHSKGKGITAALGATHFHPNVRQEALEAYDRALALAPGICGR